MKIKFTLRLASAPHDGTEPGDPVAVGRGHSNMHRHQMVGQVPCAKCPDGGREELPLSRYRFCTTSPSLTSVIKPKTSLKKVVNQLCNRYLFMKMLQILSIEKKSQLSHWFEMETSIILWGSATVLTTPGQLGWASETLFHGKPQARRGSSADHLWNVAYLFVCSWAVATHRLQARKRVARASRKRCTFCPWAGKLRCLPGAGTRRAGFPALSLHTAYGAGVFFILFPSSGAYSPFQSLHPMGLWNHNN